MDDLIVEAARQQDKCWGSTNLYSLDKSCKCTGAIKAILIVIRTTNITCLQLCPQSYHCLYPGAAFTGTQKSGWSSYDDIDLSMSFLCGYLCIHCDQDDMVHWQQFPAFCHIRNELKRPCLTMPDHDQDTLFMRWKERFLVPDHKVNDINGVDFAGFYYICVEFNLQSSMSTTLCPTVVLEDSETIVSASPQDSSVQSTSLGSPNGPHFPLPAATMSGFYYHENWNHEYQQLSLSHILEAFSLMFEFC
ncbi:vacuolar import and degradation protein-domain-containing protein [Pisolithus marmoratus]|nr:vacuolar import and degradation protein-domain-containing protein [Pisolithus marmoratus]